MLPHRGASSEIRSPHPAAGATRPGPTSPRGGEVKARGARARRAPLIGYRTVGGTTLVEPPDVEPSPALWVALEPPPTDSPLEVVNMASFSTDPFGAVATANTGCAAPRLSNEVDW